MPLRLTGQNPLPSDAGFSASRLASVGFSYVRFISLVPNYVQSHGLSDIGQMLLSPGLSASRFTSAGLSYARFVMITSSPRRGPPRTPIHTAMHKRKARQMLWHSGQHTKRFVYATAEQCFLLLSRGSSRTRRYDACVQEAAAVRMQQSDQAGVVGAYRACVDGGIIPPNHSHGPPGASRAPHVVAGFNTPCLVL